jgi:hypothetical protein
MMKRLVSSPVWVGRARRRTRGFGVSHEFEKVLGRLTLAIALMVCIILLPVSELFLIYILFLVMVKFVVMAMEPKIMIFDSATSLRVDGLFGGLVTATARLRALMLPLCLLMVTGPVALPAFTQSAI